MNKDDNRVQKLFAALSALEYKGTDEISRKQTEVEWLLSAVEIFKKFSTELRDNGTACDVATSADRLHIRAGDLKKHDVIRQTKLLFSVSSVVFQQSSFGTKMPSNVVGSIEERLSFKGSRSSSYWLRLLPSPVALAVWLSGNALASINVVALRQIRLVSGWVTVCGRVNHLGM